MGMRLSISCLICLVALSSLTVRADDLIYKVIILDEGEEVAHGLGIWVAGDILLTSSAIVELGDQVIIEDPSTGTPYVATVKSSSSSVTLLSVSGLSARNATILASEPPQEGTNVHIALPGGVQQERLSIVETTAGLSNSEYRFNMIEDSSASGAPVMNRCQQLISVVSGQTNSGEIWVGVSYPNLISYLRENRVDFTISPEPCLSIEAQLSQAQDSSEALQNDLDSLESELEILIESSEKDREQSAEQRARFTSQISSLREQIKDKESELAKQDSVLKEVERLKSESDSLRDANTMIGQRLNESDSLRIAQEAENRQKLLIVGGGAFLLILIALILLFLFWKRRRDIAEELTDTDSRLQEAEEEIARKSASFPDILLSGFGLDKEEIRIKIRGKELAQREDGIILGRSSKHADYVIVENSVSRRHASIRLIDDKVMICDLKSLNGTAVNGVNLDVGKNHPLPQGAKIVLGDVELEMTILQ